MAFDREFYLRQNPDVAASGMDPYEHYMNFGREEGRVATPNDVVDRQRYLQENPDVAAAGIDPQVHYNLFGRDEGRIPNARVAATRNPQSLMDVMQNVPMMSPEGAGIAPLAYTLATGTTLQLPEYQTAGFTPMQQQSFERAQQETEVYQPYLEEASETTMQGLGAMGDALGGTRRLASQIPNEVQPGQFALGQASGQIPIFAGQGARGADIAAERARASTAEAQRGLQESALFGRQAAGAGILGLRGTGAMYSPDMIEPFMNTFEDAAVQQALQDIARQGEIARQDVGARAVGAGAYGGSRQAVAEQELGRNVLEQQGRTAAQMRTAGFESAAQRSQEAFERGLGRQQTASQLAGQLGQMGAGSSAAASEAGGRLGLAAEQLAQGSALSGAGLQMQGAQQAGNLGLQSAQLGLSGIQAGLGAQQQAAGIGQGITGVGSQFAGLGQAAQGMGQQGIGMLSQLGSQQQQQQQAQLDAQRMNAYQQALMPYQQLAFASDIIGGAPTGITSIMSQPGPSPVSQLGGLAFGLGNLMRSFG